VLNDSRAPVLIVDAAFLPEIEKIAVMPLFLKHVVVCGGSGPGGLISTRCCPSRIPLFRRLPPPAMTPPSALQPAATPKTSWPPLHHHSHLVYCAEAMPRASLE